MTPTQVAALSGIVAFPWLIKPVYGFLSDSLPIFGYRRRSYLILSGLLGSVSWLALSGPVTTSHGALIAATVSSLSVALSDAVVDSLVAERTRDADGKAAGAYQSLCWATSAFSGLLSAYASGLIIEHVSARAVFLGTSLFPLIASLISFLVEEQQTTPQFKQLPSQFKQQTKPLWNALRQKRAHIPAVFIFLWLILSPCPLSGSLVAQVALRSPKELFGPLSVA